MWVFFLNLKQNLEYQILSHISVNYELFINSTQNKLKMNFIKLLQPMKAVKVAFMFISFTNSGTFIQTQKLLQVKNCETRLYKDSSPFFVNTQF